jgi:serine/threonine protein kinase
MIFQLCNGRLPFNSKNYDFNYHIKPYNIEQFNWNIPVDLQVLVRSMLEFNPSNRPTIDEIFIDKWIQDQSFILRVSEEEIAKQVQEKKDTTKGWGGWFSGVAKAGRELVGKIDGSLGLSDMGRSLTRGLSAGVVGTGKFMRRNVSQPLGRALKNGCLCWDDEDPAEEETIGIKTVGENKLNPVEVKRKDLKKRLNDVEREKARDRRDFLNQAVGRRARGRGTDGDVDPFEQTLDSHTGSNAKVGGTSESSPNLTGQDTLVTNGFKISGLKKLTITPEEFGV